MIDSTPALAPVAATSPAPAERSRVEEIAARLPDGTLDAIHVFGRDLGRHTASYADTLLAQVRAKHLDTIGGKLTEIVVVTTADCSPEGGACGPAPMLEVRPGSDVRIFDGSQELGRFMPRLRLEHVDVRQ